MGSLSAGAMPKWSSMSAISSATTTREIHAAAAHRIIPLMAKPRPPGSFTLPKMLIISPVTAQRKNKAVSSGEYVQQVVNSSTFVHMPITMPAMLSPLFPFWGADTFGKTGAPQREQYRSPDRGAPHLVQ
jgi:hypothetical protein